MHRILLRSSVHNFFGSTCTKKFKQFNVLISFRIMLKTSIQAHTDKKHTHTDKTHTHTQIEIDFAHLRNLFCQKYTFK